MKTKKLNVMCLILSFLVIPAALQAGTSVAMTFRGGFYSPSSSTFNTGYAPGVSWVFDEIDAMYAPFGFTTDYKRLDQVKGAISYTGEIEIFLGSYVSLAVGAEYWYKNVGASLDSSGNIGANSFDINMGYQVDLSLTPILAAVRFYPPPPVTWARPYIGLGGGYYIGRIKEYWNYDMKKNGISYNTDNYTLISKGNAILPNVNVGIELNVMRTLSLAADVRYTFGTIKSFKIDSSSADPADIGKELMYEDQNGNTVPFKWELRGLSLGISLKIKY
jgi:hypothetical protein